VSETELKIKVANEARNSFRSSQDPHYPTPVEAHAETLFELLHHRIGDEELDAVGSHLLGALSGYFVDRNPQALLAGVEAFSKFLLKLISPPEYEALRERLASEGKRLALSPVLKALNLSYKSNLNSTPDKFKGEPRFAEHVCRVVSSRNLLAHAAPELSERERAEIFESVSIFLLFAVAEHKDKIASSLFAARYLPYLETIEVEFRQWQQRFVHLESARDQPTLFGGIDPLAGINWNFEEDRKRLAGEALKRAPAPSKSMPDLLRNFPRFVLLGDPGAGKSTTLQFLAWSHARKLLLEPGRSNPLPIYLKLNRSSASADVTIRRMIAEKIACGAELSPRFLGTRVLLLLDGLNEVSEDRRIQLMEEIKSLIALHTDLRIIVTSRPNAYSGQFDIPVFRICSLGDLQIAEFLEKHLGASLDTSRFMQRLRSSSLWEWGRNPLHLAMLVGVGRDIDGTLSMNRGQLLGRFMRGLLSREERQGRQTNNITKERLIADFAFESRREDKPTYSASEIIYILKETSGKIGALLDTPRFLDEIINNNLLTRSSSGDISFAHEMYQDYFAALEIQDRLGRDPLFLETLHDDPRFEEPLVLCSELVGDYDAFIDEVSRLNPSLGARIVAQSTTDRRGLLRPLLPDGLLALIELGDSERIGAAVTSIADYDDAWLAVFRQILVRANTKEPKAVDAARDVSVWYRAATELIAVLIQRNASDVLNSLGVRTWDESRGATLSLRCFEAAIALGDLDAAVNLGNHFLSGSHIEKDETRGAALITKAAEQGSAPGMLFLAELKYLGVGLERNPKEASELLRQAAALEEPNAMNLLGVRLLDGDEMRKDVTVGHRWLSKAAETGHPPAMRDYAFRLLEGDGISRNVEEGEMWLRRAVKAGDEFAKWDLAYRLLDGDGIPQDTRDGTRLLSEASFSGKIQIAWLGLLPDEGAPKHAKVGPKWLTKAALAEIPRAMCILGNRHLEGSGMPRDYKRAEHWLRKAAEAEDSEAMEALGLMLLNGKYIQQDIPEGERWLRKAANEELPYSIWAMAELGRRLLLGENLIQNVEEGCEWLSRAMDAGCFNQEILSLIERLFAGEGLPHRADLAEGLLRKAVVVEVPGAMTVLGWRLVRGEGMPQAPAEGELWLRKSAEAGNHGAMHIYAMFRLTGDGLTPDINEGASWLRRAAEAGILEAMRELGNRLIEGIAFAIDIVEGEKWLLTSAENGHAPAMRDYGMRLYLGHGFLADQQRGIEWIEKAADNGDEAAKQMLL